MTNRIVVCANDYPHAVLDWGDEAMANRYCQHLQATDPRNVEMQKKYNYAKWAPITVFYHWHQVPEVDVYEEIAKEP